MGQHSWFRIVRQKQTQLGTQEGHPQNGCYLKQNSKWFPKAKVHSTLGQSGYFSTWNGNVKNSKGVPSWQYKYDHTYCPLLTAKI